jgi:hypothetical protein
MTEAMRDGQRRFSVGHVARLPDSRAAEARKAIRLERCPVPGACSAAEYDRRRIGGYFSSLLVVLAMNAESSSNHCHASMPCVQLLHPASSPPVDAVHDELLLCQEHSAVMLFQAERFGQLQQFLHAYRKLVCALLVRGLRCFPRIPHYRGG